MPLGMSKNAFFVNQTGKKLAFQETNNNSFNALYVADNGTNQFSDTAILPSYQFMIYRIDETTREWEYFIRCEEDQFTQSAYDVMSRDGELYVCGGEFVVIKSLTAQDSAQGLSMQVQASFDGYFKFGEWLPVQVELENNGPDLTGEVQVSVSASQGVNGKSLAKAFQIRQMHANRKITAADESHMDPSILFPLL